MKLSWDYWWHQALLGALIIGGLAILGHLNYAQWTLVAELTVADGYFLLSWGCFPWAKWVVTVDQRPLQVPTVGKHRRKRGNRDQTRQAKATVKVPLKWYWRVGLDVLLAFIGPVILGGYGAYSLRHN